MILAISLRPERASTFLPPRLMLTFSLALAVKSLLSSRCRMLKHTNTPQSLPFSWIGESSRCTNRIGRLRSAPNLDVTVRASQ